MVVCEALRFSLGAHYIANDAMLFPIAHAHAMTPLNMTIVGP